MQLTRKSPATGIESNGRRANIELTSTNLRVANATDSQIAGCHPLNMQLYYGHYAADRSLTRTSMAAWGQ